MTLDHNLYTRLQGFLPGAVSLEVLCKRDPSGGTPLEEQRHRGEQFSQVTCNIFAAILRHNRAMRATRTAHVQ